MKFLCRNCKSKYQIADEKVAGRTLRMTCQQCGEPIVVRGSERGTRSVSRPLSQPMSAASLGAAPVPSALGADFQRQVGSPSADLGMGGARSADEWHVAINDVPVGPMRREEVARKVSTGAVDRESLAWREGMDDWLPLRHIPELAMLCEPRAPAPLVAPPPAAMAPPPASVQQPAARVDMAPIGGHQVMTLAEYAAPPEPLVSTVTVEPITAPAPAGGKPLGWAPMFTLVAGGAFILAAGAYLGVRVLAPPTQQDARTAPVAAAEAQPTAAKAPADPNAARDGEGNVIQLDMQAIAGQSNGAGTRRPTTAAAAAPAPAPGDKTKGKQLTDEQRATLARMGGGLDQGPSTIHTTADTAQGSTSSGGQLTAEKLSGVVLRGRKNLQRCYETALRGAGSDETVRLDVEIEVSPSGNVTSVKTTGKGLPGMDECITRTVRMWRFPSSGQGAQTRFPVVFQPGA